MSLYLETIALNDGVFLNPVGHNERMNRTRRELLGSRDDLDLREFIDGEKAPFVRTKCRVLYDIQIREVTYESYKPRVINSFKLIEAPGLNYAYKSANRTLLNRYLDQKGDCDDVIFTQQGCLTDSSYANIALYNGTDWITPNTPLLRGVRRNELLEKKLIIEGVIPVSTLSQFTHIMWFNALLRWQECVLPISALRYDF